MSLDRVHILVLVCDCCGAKLHFEDFVGGADMRRRSEEHGWTHTMEGDWCLLCTAPVHDRSTCATDASYPASTIVGAKP